MASESIKVWNTHRPAWSVTAMQVSLHRITGRVMAVVVGNKGQKMARPFSSSIQANHIPPITATINQESTETSGSTRHLP